jgi:type 1 fimbria pilin
MAENMSTPFYATAPRRHDGGVKHDVGIKIYDTNGKVMVNGGGWTRNGAKTITAENNSLTFSAAPASATGPDQNPERLNAYATVTLEIELIMTAVYDSRCHISPDKPGLYN